MNKIRNKFLLLRGISIFIVLTFLPVNIIWADPFLRVKEPTLAAELLSGQELMSKKSLETRNGIISSVDLYGSILAACRYLLGEKLPLKFLSTSIEDQMGYVVEGLEVDAVTSLDHFEAVKQGDATALDAPQALSEEDVIVIPYKIKGQENMIYAARKKNPKLAQLKGKTASLSDEYDVKIPPIKKHDNIHRRCG